MIKLKITRKLLPNFRGKFYVQILSGFLLFTSLLSACSNEEPPLSYKDSSLTPEVRADLLLSQLSLQEKICQMRIFRSGDGGVLRFTDQGELELSDLSRENIDQGIAGIKNAGVSLNPKDAAKFTNLLQAYIIENNRFGIPGLFIAECYHGVEARGNTFFCRPITMSSSFNADIVHQLWYALGAEARLRGLHMCHSPEGDLARDPRFGRMSETFGEDPYLTSRMIVSAVTGVQGDQVGLKSTHIGAVTKHFAGYAQVEGGKNFASMQISPRSFIDEILPPFEAAVKEAHTLGIMASHADVNGVASHANHELLTNVLKLDWGFDGYVVSDATDIERLHHFMKVAETFEDAAEMALRAGMDVDLYGTNGYALLEKMVETKPDLLPLIDQAARRVLLTKFKLGLFENPYVDEDAAESLTHSKANQELALAVDQESIILLKNEGEILPLQAKRYNNVAVIGPNASQEEVEAIKGYFPSSTKVNYAKGCGITKPIKEPTLYSLEEDLPYIKEAVSLAKKSDVILLFIGGDSKTSKEAYFIEGYGDRADLNLVGQQDLLLDELKKTGKKIVVVLEHRRTLSIVNVAEKADAIIDCWELSERGADAIASVLFGEVNPSGKLPVTVPRSVGQLPVYYYQKHINFKKGYLFADNSPLYPFGFGLSYTQFEYSNIKLSNSTPSIGEDITVSFDLKNVGTKEGKEVCQLYLQDEFASVERPIRELKGFEKISLKAGETTNVTFTITPEMMSFTGIDMTKTIEPGAFHVYVGGSSATTQQVSYKLVK